MNQRNCGTEGETSPRLGSSRPMIDMC